MNFIPLIFQAESASAYKPKKTVQIDEKETTT